MNNLLNAFVSFGLLTVTVVSLAQIPALRVGAGVNEGTPRVVVRSTQTRPIATTLGNFDTAQLRQWDVSPNGRSATSENGILTIGGKSYRTITNEFTPKGTFVVGKPYVASNTGVVGYPFKVVFIRDLDDRNPAKSEFLKLGNSLDTINSYAIHEGSKSYGCIVLSAKDMKEVGPFLEGTTIKIK